MESLVNEILLNLFEFIPPLDLFRGFCGLNSRFNTLIFVRFVKYHFNFRSISREDLNIICRVYLPLIVDQIISFRFSDDDDTPRQSIDFLSYNLNLSQFKYLRSLTFQCIQFRPKINEYFLIEMANLHNLTHLKFLDCHIESENNEYSLQLINQIWSHSKLIYFYCDMMFYSGKRFVIPTVVSLSLKHLYIHHITWKFEKLVRLMEKTPHLQYFSTSAIFTNGADVHDYADQTPPLSQNLSMRKLKLSGITSSRIMINILYRMSNLSSLNIQKFFLSFDGYQWQTIIRNSLPKLKIFCLNMSYDIDKTKNKENEIDQLLDTYRSSFWIEEHQWYMGCLWNSFNDNRQICLYSLPFYFQNSINNDSQSDYQTKSTYLSNIKYSYDHIRSLHYESALFKNTEFSNVIFNRIESLVLTLPFDNLFFSIIPNFDHLLSLGLYLSNNYPFQLQFLLDKTPRLVELEFLSWSTKEMPPFNVTSTSIRRLNLLGRDEFRYRHRFDRQQCITLSKSSLAIQCQVLRIEVESPLGIIELVPNLINLRTLHVYYQNDSRGHRPEFLEWLKRCLPSTLTVIRKSYGYFIIQL